MVDADKARLGLLLAMLGECFRREITAPMLNGFWIGLSDLELCQVEQAVEKSIRASKFFPSVAELREFAGNGSEVSALSAWADVQSAMGLGSYRHIDFSNPLINATIRNLGGWPAMFERLGSAEDEKWYRQEFLRVYRAFESSGGASQEACQPLAGLAEIETVSGVTRQVKPRRIECKSASQALEATKAKRITSREPLAASLASGWGGE